MLTRTLRKTARALVTSVSRRNKLHPSTQSEFINVLEMIDPLKTDRLPVYRVMNRSGAVLQENQDPNFTKEQAVKRYKAMIKLNEFDRAMYDAQRQGRFSFYMTSYGEEAAQIGSIAALDSNDLVFAQYREAGVIFYRGYTYQQAVDQCFGNESGHGSGRQMPIHYGSKDLGYVTISSTLTTQLPQAAGSAFALRRAGDKRVVMCYFGEGAASEGDAHAAFNFATTLDCPVIFFCRNNGFAISTPAEDQYSGDGIASRAAGYGMITIRVDGNDLMAVHNATVKAREIALSDNRPILIEAMTYRQGNHSTSDDSRQYRSPDEISIWEKTDHPISRFREYLLTKGWWSLEEDAALQKSLKKDVLSALRTAEKKKKPSVDKIFEDVYDELTPELERQKAELMDHLEQYGDHYNLDKYAK